MTTVDFKGLWDETLLPWRKGVDSHTLTSEASREVSKILGTCSLLKMGLGAMRPLVVKASR